MCYWFVKSTKEPGDTEKAVTSDGINMLKTYKQTVESLPQLQASWNTDRAKELLAELKPR